MLLLLAGQERLRTAVAGMDQALTRRPGREELLQDSRRPAIVLLAVNLGFYLCYSTVFYFMQHFASRAGEQRGRPVFYAVNRYVDRDPPAGRNGLRPVPEIAFTAYQFGGAGAVPCTAG